MKRKTYGMVGCLVGLLSAGCASIVGTWHRETVTMGQDKFPIDVITFDDAGSFTATGFDNSSEHTWTGLYRWHNKVLTFTSNHREPQSFSARLPADDKLVMTDEHDNNAQVASFKRLPEP